MECGSTEGREGGGDCGRGERSEEKEEREKKERKERKRGRRSRKDEKRKVQPQIKNREKRHCQAPLRQQHLTTNQTTNLQTGLA